MPEIEYDKLGDAVERAARSEGLELVGWELKGEGPKALLRITIDTDEGVTHENCVAVTRHVGTLLDVEDLIPHGYTLEVTSPGLGKALVDQASFDRHRGETARVRANEPVEGRTSFKGRIERVTPTGVTLVDVHGREHQIEFRQIVAANVVQAPARRHKRPVTGGQE
jgi:ribosome maturation factor RimP